MYDDRVEVKGNFVVIEPLGEEMNMLPQVIQNEEIGETHEYNRNDD